MMRMNRDTKKRFSIRKLTIGAVSVMFGAVIFGVSTNQVQAATEPAAQTSHQDPQTTETNDQANQQTNTQHETQNSAANYNEQVQKNAPALIQNPADKVANAQTKKDNDGVATEMSLSAKNKNTNEASEVKANTNLNKGNGTSDVDINPNTAKDLDFNITLHNTTEQNKNVSGGNYWYELPAWNGTNKKVVVDANRLKRDEHGNIVFDGNYQDKGLTISNFDLATDATHSTGLNHSVQDASVDPSKIGGFMVSGTIQAGDTATITIPLMVRDSEQESAVDSTERIGVFSNNYRLNVRAAKVESDLDAQKDKKYFLVDTSKTSGNAYHEIEQSVLNDLNKDGVTPTYQAGDIQLNNFGFNEQNTNGQNYLTAGGYVIYRDAVSRLNHILNKYGYQVDNVPGAEGITFGDGAYALSSALKFYDANGNAVQLGRGDLSNFFIPVKQVVKQSNVPAIIDYESPQANVEREVKSMFNSDNGLTFTGIDQIDTKRPGVYQVTASKGNVSRSLKVIVVEYAGNSAYKASDSKHVDILPTQIISDGSLRDLENNGYRVVWAKDAQGNELKPTYVLPGQKNVRIAIIDPDGRDYETNDTVDVLQGINVHFVERTYDANGKLVSTKEDKVIRVYGSVGHNGNYISDPQTIGLQEGQFRLNPDWQNLVNKGFSVDGIKNVKFLSQKDNQNVTVYVDHHEEPTKKGDDTKPVKPVQPTQPTQPTTPGGNNTNPTPVPEVTSTPAPSDNTPASTPVLPENTPAAPTDETNSEPEAALVHGQKAPAKPTNNKKSEKDKKVAKINKQKANKGNTSRAEVAPVHAARVKPEKGTSAAKVVKTANVKDVPNKQSATLPQTGAENTSVLGVIGMLLAGLGLFGLDRRKKKN